jgi:hypothetical protein
MLTKWFWKLLRKTPPRFSAVEPRDPYQGLPEAAPQYESGRGNFRPSADATPRKSSPG